jgi:hypothetical protein
MKLQQWLITKVNDVHKAIGGWQSHPIWKHKYIKIPINIGFGTVVEFKKYFDKMLRGKTVDCRWVVLRFGGFNIKTQEITIWQV